MANDNGATPPPDLYAQGILKGSGGGGGGGGAAQAKDPTNEQLGTHDTKRMVYNVTGVLTGEALPFNIATALENGGMQQGLETEGIAGKTIASLADSMNSRGGVLAKIAHDIFLKNREITDHTQGVGGNVQGEGGGAAAAGGSDGAPIAAPSGGSDGGDHIQIGPVMASVAGTMANESMANLGELRPLPTPNLGQSRGAGMDV